MKKGLISILTVSVSAVLLMCCFTVRGNTASGAFGQTGKSTVVESESSETETGVSETPAAG